jgi:hypothetical protein
MRRVAGRSRKRARRLEAIDVLQVPDGRRRDQRLTWAVHVMWKKGCDRRGDRGPDDGIHVLHRMIL